MNASYYHVVRGMAAVQSAWQAWLVQRGLAEEKALAPAAGFLEQVFLNRLMLPSLEPLYPAFLAWMRAETGIPDCLPGPEAIVIDWGGRLMLRLDLEVFFSILRGYPAKAARRDAPAAEIEEWKALSSECRAMLPGFNFFPEHASPDFPDGEAQDWLVSYLASYSGQPLRLGQAPEPACLERLLRPAARLQAGLAWGGEAPAGVEAALEALIRGIKLLSDSQEEKSCRESGLGTPIA